MGRRRHINRVALTTINVSIETADRISKLKNRKETQDDFIRRILTDWQDFQEYKLDMDQVLKLKDRRITRLESELRNLKQESTQTTQTTTTSILTI